MFTISFYRYQEERGNRTIPDKQSAHAFEEFDNRKLSEVAECKHIFTSNTNGIYISDIWKECCSCCPEHLHTYILCDIYAFHMFSQYFSYIFYCVSSNRISEKWFIYNIKHIFSIWVWILFCVCVMMSLHW